MNDFSAMMILSSIIAAACPIIFAAIGETITEKSGVINLSLDGTILLSAMTAFVISYSTGSVFLGFFMASLVGGFVALIVVFFSIYLRVSQVAVGFVLTLTCRDLAYFIGNPYSRLLGPQVQPLPIPFLSDLPFIGTAFFSHNVVVYVCYIFFFFSWFYIEKTPMGHILKAVGEHPHAAYSRGIHPHRIQLIYGFVGGVFVGIAGASYSLFMKAGWGRPQGCEGIGWIALALVIFGGWNISRVVIGCYLFSFLQVMGIFFQQWFPTFPSPVFQVAPFPLMIFSLVIIHVSQNDKIREWSKDKNVILFFLNRFSHSAPAHLGKRFHV
ncbi:MAG: ABC transporter permease [Proteobacteria bacterium]|nr:ABC transporter permease [Pseudomonadota bacterium]